MNLKPFRIKMDWYYVVRRKMYGPFETKDKAMEVYEIAMKLDKLVGKKRKDGRRGR